MWPLQFPTIPSQENFKFFELSKINTESLKTEFSNVFKDGFGLFIKGTLTLQLQPGTQPKFIHPRKLPFSLRDKVEAEISRLQKNKIIEPVEYSEWGTPIVPVLKSDGSVRLCGDLRSRLILS